MERKNFIKNLLVGAVSTPVLIEACKKSSTAEATPSTETVTTTGATNTSCTVAPTETEGPFPTKSPSSYVRSDIRDDREGYKMTVKIKITNSNSSCTPLVGALVDIWHCDKDGSYSEYGGTGMQAINYQSVHFLRGRQVTDSDGMVTFTTIFPGWYTGRATHIHVHVYKAGGTSVKVTQISFPEGSGSALAIVNGYSKGLSGYTYNKSDNIFSDDTAGIQLATVTGSIAAGFNLSTQINVPA
jgi:protocatechuate 3,4-dioxygenase beta subunit